MAKAKALSAGAMIIMASAPGTPVPPIARLVAADEDTVHDVIHLFTRMRVGVGVASAADTPLS